MPINSIFDSFSPARHDTGLSNPNYAAPQAPQLGAHPWLQPFERTQYFEDNPRQAFHAFSPQFGTGQQRQSLLQSLSPIYDQYLGQLGRGILSGGAPQGGFVDYLSGGSGYDTPFDFDAFYRENSPGARERRDASLQPSVRYLY